MAAIVLILHRMKNKYLITLLSLFLSISTARAKQYSYLRFTTEDGLAGNNIYFIVQDREGFIWIATETGLSRFDGTYFKNYTQKDGLGNNDIPALLLDKKERLWVHAFGTQLSYIYKGKVQHVHNDTVLSKFPQRAARNYNIDMMEDKEGNLLFAYENNIIYLNQLNQVCLIKKEDTCPLMSEPVQNVAQIIFPAHMLFSGLGQGLINTRSVVVLPADWLAVYLSSSKICFFNRNVPKHTAGFKNEIISSIRPYSDSLCLISTHNGCYLYNMAKGSMADTIVSGFKVNFSFVDKEGGIWVGGEELFYFPPGRAIAIQPKINDNNFIQINYITSYENEIWAGSKNLMLWKLHWENDYRLEAILAEARNYKHISQTDGNVQISPEFGTLQLLLSGKYEDYVFGQVKSLSGKKDTFTISCYDGTIKSFTLSGNYQDSFNVGIRPTCALKINDNHYIGTLEGLYHVFNKKPVTRGKTILKECITSLSYSYPQGLLWVATSNQGVYCLKNDTIIRHIDKTNGLSSDLCKCLYNDGRKVYAGTLDGLNVIDPENNFELKTYYTLDGLSSNNINCIYAYAEHIFIGTSEGINILNQSDAVTPPFCNIVLTEVSVSGKPVSIDSPSASLGPGDNNIQFFYSGLSFRSMKKIKYYYRLKGLSDKWQQTDQNYLKYPSLPPGKYELELFAVNRYHISSKIIKYNFIIEKYWWQHMWLQFFISSVLFSVIFLAVYLRLRKQKRKDREALQLKNKILELEQLALRSQMNPHFIFNSLNSFYQYVINQDLGGASAFMSNFSRLIRILFETTTLTETVLGKEIEFLTAYLTLEQIKLRGKFDFKIEISKCIKVEYILIPTFIIQPFIENSIKHGVQNREDNAGMILLNIEPYDQGIIISVDDNGMGRKFTASGICKDKSHISRGINLTKERIDLYNKIHGRHVRIEFIDKDGYNATGTCVNIYIEHKPL
jgi:ligand-binding sensor domain-containing protein